MRQSLDVATPSAKYQVKIAAGLLADIGAQLQSVNVGPSQTVFLITDENVHKLGYAEQVVDTLAACGYTCHTAVVPPGDESKSLATAESLYNAMLDNGVRRNSVVLALGGGVVGDLAGFVAATFMRGIAFVQLPTTLLAHDSSIGGKVGVNLARGKNLVGAFHHPLAVLYDTQTLSTIPDREWQGGMAEVIKHGIIGDVQLFEALEAHPVASYADAADVESMLARACSVKIDVVNQDEHERGRRMLLNLGHTIGHAVELLSHYRLNHGQAVAIGIALEADLATSRGWLNAVERDRIKEVLRKHGLPVTPPAYTLEEVVNVLSVDKKHVDHRHWTFALPKSIGLVEVARDVTYREVAETWRNAF